MDSIATLQQLDQECNTWANQHAHSCNLLASLVNITRQREQTLIQWQQQQLSPSQNIGMSSSNSKGKSLLSPSTLQLLIHKQTLEIESVINQLYDTIQVFKKVLQAMAALERQVEAAIQRMDTSKLLNTVNFSAAPASSTSSLSEQNLIPADTAAGRPSNSPSIQPSTATLMDTAEISPLDVLDWVSRIRAMYAHELNVKQTQIHPSMTSLDRSWGLQKRIDFALEQEIIERIKTYRRVRELASRV
ncbi:hypothetical protein BGX21_006735 [Mortierella sp. AD011]|nr:hypothetical protein BGX21_006735 [Mortierella sp. AD011]